MKVNITTPVHSLKLPGGEIVTRQGWLGSGIFDKNGAEIFEYDLVKIDGEPELGLVHYIYGSFVYKDVSGEFWPLSAWNDKFEVVGHVTNAQPVRRRHKQEV